MKNLTDKEKSLMIEALLFASSVDICAEWNGDTLDEFVKIAEKLQDKNTNEMKHIYLSGKAKNFEEFRSKYIKNHFNIKRK